MTSIDFSSWSWFAIPKRARSSSAPAVSGRSGRAAGGRGKRGGARTIYFWHPKSQHILMLFAYPKNERADLTPAQKRALRKVVEAEYP